MNKLIGILFITAAASGLATAQQPNTQSNAPAPSTTRAAAPQTDRIAPPKTEGKFVIDLSQTQPQIDGRIPYESGRQGLVIPSLQWVFKDGAVYLDFGNGMLIPVLGGGASGCFGLDLPTRMDKVRTSIEAFPPRPTYTPPPPPR